MNLSKPQKLVYDMERYVGGAISVICGGVIYKGTKTVDELQNAVNTVFHINEAFRTRIAEDDGKPSQYISGFQKKAFEVLYFKHEQEYHDCAQKYAKEPMNLYGELCDVKIAILPEAYGIIIKIHHLVGDAWTLALVGTQFNEILNGNLPQAFSYTEYIESEQKYINSERYKKDKAYFSEQFAMCSEATYISEKQTEFYSADRSTYVISKSGAKTLTEYADKKETSVFTLFMMALSIYLSRTHMNTEKFYIGTAVINRTGAKERNTAGMFINTVPVLAEINNECSFADNIGLLDDRLLATFRHQKYNYGDILADIRKENNFTEKLYDVMFSYQNAKIAGASGEYNSYWYHSGCQTESLQIHIDDRDDEHIFKVHYDYLTEKFSADDIEVLHNHILNILFDGIGNENRKPYELRMLTANEKEKLLRDFNDTAVEYPRDKCVHRLFEEQVQKTPDKTAVIACDKTLFYAELNEEANRIAHALIEKGIGVGDIVSFALPRKSYLIAVIFGILKSGAAYLPVDLDYPQERIHYILDDSNAKLFITESNIDELLSNKNTINPGIPVSSEELCYSIYTSGSTGNPKGALLKHRGIVNLVTNLNIYSNLSGCKRFGFMTTITFDVATQEILTTLLNGFTGVLMPERKETRPDEIIESIIANQIDVMYATPTYFESLTDTKEKAEKLLSVVKVVCLAGEKFYLNSHALKYKDRAGVIFENQYGPVELHVIATATTYKNNDFDSIGKPIGNNKAYILDKYMQLVPIGVVGELCVAGDGVGAGYLNHPDLTAEKFINNPFGEGKLYKTGDLAYWRDDGNIAYVGRNDFQVKIRGLRIELGEIESALCSIDGISQAVVVVRKNNEGRQLICAFYTGVEVSAKEIRTQIGKKLPKYMLPHIFTHLDEMPLTSSGKINRKSLPEADLYAIDTTVEYTAPQTEQEKVLVSAVEAVLCIEKAGILDNFFDLGGDSLKAIELISKLENQGYHTDTKTIFNCDTIQELAQQLTFAETAEEEFDYTGDIPASPAQMRVYTAQSMQADTTLYNIPYMFNVESLDIARLQNAIDQLILRHEILRTHFENKDGNIIQVIDDDVNCMVENWTDNDICSFIRPFDLSKSPLLRVGYFENTVMIDMHHIVTDGSSMPVFLNELNELYMGRTLQGKPVQYKRFAIQQQDHTESEKYWLSVYNDEPPELTINTDFKRGQKQTFNGAAVYDTIDIGLHDKILAKCKEQNITPYVFYMSGFNILLSKFSGCEDIVVGIPVSGREGKFLNTIGMFVNTIALRNKPVGTKSVAELLQDVKENSITAIEHQDYPFGELVKKLGLNTSDRNPLFDVMFAYQSEQMTDVVFGDKKAELLPIPVTSSKYDFTFNIMPRNDNVVIIMVEYCTDLYNERTIQRFINGYKQILEQMLDSSKVLKNISAILPLEQKKLFFDFNNTAVEYSRDKCVHQLFEEQAQKTPDKTAVIACDKALSYAELNEEANRIAYALIEKGIGVGDIIAFALPRKSYLISVMFGILKSGAAYLPIDPDYPQERIDYILNDSNAKLFITESDIDELFCNKNTINPNISVSSEGLCYCIYTSGSTGMPKGVKISHKSTMNFIQNNKQNHFQNILLDCCECITSLNSIVFDIALQETVLPLVNGKYIILLSNEEVNNIGLVTTVFNNRVCGLIITPTRLAFYMENQAFLESLYNFKVIMCGAESFPIGLLDLIQKYTQAHIFNGYGPTETTCGVSYAKVVNKSDVTIGKPIANTKIYIVDKYIQPVPIGVTGELCIAGDGVGVGYLNRPELTAEKFIDNPFGEGKLYKTGDLAYWREDGNIAYVGRNDFQVKIRGLRIELGEIESALCSIDGISQAVVVMRKNNEGRQLICAFYTGAEVSAKEIRTQIGKKLPKYMLPHIFTHLNEMPLTSSGKINRKALPEVDLYNIDTTVEFVEPETDQQKILCTAMGKVLNVDTIGIDDDFFELGGDSLKAIEFVSKAHSENVIFSLQNVFDFPTVRLLDDYINLENKNTYLYDAEDFTEIHRLIGKPLPSDFIPDKSPVGDILLTGSTGFLGIHILAEYLENDNGTAYCVVRGNDEQQAENRLTELLKYYFDEKFINLLGDRIKVLCGDITKGDFGIPDLPHIDTIIHTAATVKHYGSYEFFKSVNVNGTVNAINIAKKQNAKLIHISTLSISGNSTVDVFDKYHSEEEKFFSENDLYIGQPLDNVYIRSKFEAEREVYNAVLNGLKANVIRVGNLTNRASDMKFQPNYQSNAFLKRVKAVFDLGCLPEYIKDLYCEFAPIDDAANAIMRIVRHFNMQQIVFNASSNKEIYFYRIQEIVEKIGINLRFLDEEQFANVLEKTQSTDKSYIYESLINDMDENGKLIYDTNIRIVKDITVDYLKQLGFEWSDIGTEYIRKYIGYFKNIGYFM